jgi:hypothetical protein
MYSFRRWADVKNVQSNAVLATFYEILNQKVRGIAGGFFSAETANIQLAAKIYGVFVTFYFNLFY